MKRLYQLLLKKQRISKNFRSAFLRIAFLLSGFSAEAQVRSYTFSQSSGTYTPVTSGNVLATASANSTVASLYNIVPINVPLPFVFNFNGTNYSSFNVSSNGFITFGTTLPSNNASLPISFIGGYDGCISAWGASLNSFVNIGGKTGEISTQIVGNAPNREMVIQWNNFRPTYSSSTVHVYSFSFQIRLRETSNTIAMVYDNGSYAVGYSAITGTTQVGLRGETSADYNSRLNAATLAFGSSTFGAESSSSQVYNTSLATPGMPTAGLTYVWTPSSCFRPTDVSSSALSTTGALVSWGTPVPSPANGVDVYYTTNSVPPDANTIPTISGVIGSSVQLSSLLPATNYKVYLRSSCSASIKSEWTEVHTFNTACLPITTYYSGFEDSTTGSYLPNCWSRLLSSTLPGTLVTSTTLPAEGSKSIYAYTSSTSPNIPGVAVLPIISNLNAGTHWLRFRTRITVAGTGTLQVGYVTDSNDLTTFNLLGNISVSNIIWNAGSDEKRFVIPSGVTIPAGARLALKTINDGKYFYIDELYWDAIPTCYPPTDITSPSSTGNSVVVDWTAATPNPTNGYEVFYSTNNTSPIATTTPSVSGIITNSTNITGLSPLTQYYVWVRSKCSATDSSAWSAEDAFFTTTCQPPVISSVTDASFCSGQSATLSAASDIGSTITWYSDATTITPLGLGTTYTTPSLTSTTNYWVTSSAKAQGYVGKATPTSTTGSGLTSNLGMVFNAHKPMVIETVDVYPIHASNTSGTITIELKNSANVTLETQTQNVVVSPTGSYNAVQLNFAVPIGTGYKLVVTGKSATITSFLREDETSNFSFPYASGGICTITGTTTVGFYYYLYNWKVSAQCESPRQQVTAILNSGCLGTSESEKKSATRIYPNPFHDVISISDIANVKSLSVMDISGRVVRTVENVSANSINLSELKEGLYILNLNYKDGSTLSQKIIKK